MSARQMSISLLSRPSNCNEITRSPCTKERSRIDLVSDPAPIDPTRRLDALLSVEETRELVEQSAQSVLVVGQLDFPLHHGCHARRRRRRVCQAHTECTDPGNDSQEHAETGGRSKFTRRPK